MPAGFGMATTTFVVVSSMVGAGVLTTSGYTVKAVGSNQLMLWLWVVGGVIALCGALSLAEVSAALPATGGDYVFLYEAYGPLAAFLSGWVSFLIGFAAPIAATSFASAKYLLAPLGLEEPTARLAQRGLATAAILVLAAVHNSGRERTIRVQGTITLLKIGVLVALTVAGLAVGWGHWGNLIDRPPITRDVAWEMAFSSVYISYAYTGWNAAAYLAGEVGDPGRRLPRAMLLGTAGVVALYLGLNAVYALALPAAEVAGIKDVGPIAEIAGRRLFGDRVAGPLSVAVGLTLLASLSAYVLTGPRVLYAMARAGQFPAIAGRLTSRSQTPAVATALQVGWALVVLWVGTLGDILIYAGVGLALFSMLAVSSIYALRVTRPDLPRPFRTPGYPLVPAVFLLGTALLTAAAFSKQPIGSTYAAPEHPGGRPGVLRVSVARRSEGARSVGREDHAIFAPQGSLAG